MRTTIRLPDPLYDRVRASAAEANVTVTSYIEQALQDALTRHDAKASEPYRVPAFPGRGLRPGVVLDDNDALADLMDEDDADDARG